ncbi:branched-chain amino acid transaminase [bacterium]|nr:branched-chain amino acid transaminase [bacterium]NCQ55263.1 branched-chain amino acid transaminase [Candidatus Parcubacteria bacterium]NCS67224.1 branched-chain amino acid transaminase [Candidatus Peregrinibacteria bacterium]NCS96479.1 branched-chain amino acid transaminase [bacterium]
MDFGAHVWRNGQLIKSEDAKTSLINHALHYGSGVFEGIRCYKTERGTAVFRLKEHMERLQYSGSVLEIKMPHSVQDLCQATLELLKANNLESGYIRPVACFGEGKMGLNPHGADIDVFIAAWAWGKYLSDDPITVGTSPWIRIHPKSLQADAKINGHYVNSIMSSQWAHNNNYQEALLLDYKGNLAEGPGENLFIIKDGEMFTPELGTILNGITRATIMELSEKELGIKTIQKTLTPADLLNADEAFFTGTAAEVTILKSIDGNQIGTQANEISGQLKQLYADVVEGRVEKYNDWLSYV